MCIRDRHRGGGLVQVGLLALKVTFTPYDRLRFSTAECTVNVDVIPRKFRQANTSYIDNKKIGTAFEDLGLPNAFYFFAAADEPNHEGSGLNGSVPGIIKWDDSNYDPNSYEEQTIYGEVNRAEFETVSYTHLDVYKRQVFGEIGTVKDWLSPRG